MKINIAILGDWLEEKYPIRKRMERNCDLSLNHAILYSPDILFSEGGVYVAKGSELPKKASFPDECAFISIGSAPPIYKQGRCDYIELSPNAPLISVFNEIQAAYDDFGRWYDEVERAIMDNKSLQDIYDIGLIKTINPVYCITSDYELLAYSEYPNLVGEANLYADYETRAELVNELKLNEAFITVFQTRDPTIWIDENYDFDTLYCNIVLNDTEAGLVLIDGRSRPIKRSDYVVIKILRDSTEFVLNRRSTSFMTGYRGFESLLKDILSGVSVDSSLIKAELEKLNWSSKSGFYCCLLQMESRDFSINNAIACSNQIEHSIAFTYAFPLEDKVLVLFPAAQWENSPSYFISALAPILREGLYKAALSHRFFDIHELPLYYHQASGILAAGLKSDSTDWMFNCDDYLLPYMIEHSIGDLSPRLLCHSKLLLLMQYDEENHVEYVKTLRSYVENNCSQAECCRAMFIHRSTLLQRLARIKELTGFDLDDNRTRLYLRMILAAFQYFDA